MIVVDAAPGIALPEAVIVLIVEAAGITFAVPQPAVAQVTAPVPVTPLPLVPDFVDGLVGVGGAILPQIDLRRRLGLPGIEASESGELLVILAADGNYALRVDHVVTLATLESDTVQEFASGPGSDSALNGDLLSHGVISGEFPWRQRTVLLLHPNRIGLQTLAPGAENLEIGAADGLTVIPVGLAAAAPAEPHHVYVLARCGPGHFALPVEQVAEVVPAGTITPIPGASAEVLGLTQLRGRPVPVLQPAVMAAPLALPNLAGPASIDANTDDTGANTGVLMVVNTIAGRFALRVDAVAGVKRFPLSRIHAGAEASGTVEGRAGYLIDLDNRVIGLLDADRLVTAGGAATWRGLLPPVEKGSAVVAVVPTRHLLVFRIDSEWYAIDASLVMHLTGYRPTMPVPETGTKLVGLVEIGADVLPVIDLRTVLGAPALLDEWTAMIVVRYANVRWAVITDRIDRLVVVPATTLYPADAPVHRLVSAIVSLGDRLISLLDLGPILHDRD